MSDGHKIVDHLQAVFLKSGAASATDILFQARPLEQKSLGVGNDQPVANASGTATGAGQTTSKLQDTGKAWVTNAYAGHYVVCTGGTGAGQIRLIASNTGTDLTVGALFTTTPVAASTTYEIRPPGIDAPVVRSIDIFHQAGTAASVVIQSVALVQDTITTDTLWRYDPLSTAASGQASTYVIRKGRPGAEIRVVTAGTATFTGTIEADGFFLNDPTATRMSDIKSQGVNNDQDINLASGTATGAGQSSTVLQDTGKAWTVNAYVGHYVVITGGTGVGQAHVITANTATNLTVGLWTTVPVAASSTYEIRRLTTSSSPSIELVH